MGAGFKDLYVQHHQVVAQGENVCRVYGDRVIYNFYEQDECSSVPAARYLSAAGR